MLAAIRDFFDRNLKDPAAASAAPPLHLATAALLIETAMVDGDVSPDERTAVVAAVRSHLGLAAAEADALVALAQDEMRQANDYFQFTSLINAHYTPEQKEQVIETMWSLALVDDAISAHERHLLRRIGELLHVPHGAFIAAKMRAEARRGGAA